MTFQLRRFFREEWLRLKLTWRTARYPLKAVDEMLASARRGREGSKRP